jgi:tetratricopeptide (TPR) repeat protein
MKIKIYILGVVVLLATSCSKSFLEVVPESYITSSTFFTTESDYSQAVSGAYAVLHDVYSDAYVMGEMRSDNTDYNFKANDRGGQNIEREDITGFVDNSSNMFSNNKYYSCYRGISRCNAILDRIDGSSISDASKQSFGGETKFLRAFYYFELVRYFGDVPLYLKEVKSQSESALPRSPVADVYTQIIKDATDASNQLPSTQSQKGRVTQGSALTLLGYIYMTLIDYPKADAALKGVTALGYNLMPNYADIFKTINKNNIESIFEVQYIQGDQGLQNNFTYQFIPALDSTVFITGLNGNNQSFGGWNIPSDDLLAAYETGDNRKAASIVMGYNRGNGVFIPSQFIAKYLNPHNTWNNCNDDWMVYRYADVLLLLAECLNEEGKSSEALPYLNEVRNRAGLTDISLTNQGLLRDIIAHERRVELAFENHRWLDLVRTGKAIDVMNVYGVKTKQENSYLLSRTYIVTADKLIFPIPFNEFLVNPALRQNNGY